MWQWRRSRINRAAPCSTSRLGRAPPLQAAFPPPASEPGAHNRAAGRHRLVGVQLVGPGGFACSPPRAPCRPAVDHERTLLATAAAMIRAKRGGGSTAVEAAFVLGLCDGERPVASGRLTQVADAAGFLRDAGSGASLSTRAVQVSKHLRDGPVAEAAPRRGQQRGHSNARPYH
jgi:hypothetical protein